jgi:ribosomal protein S21
MLIVELKNCGNNIEKALKTLKSKVIKTKQTQILFERREFVKDSVKNRSMILKASYIEKKNK